ncbi:MAG: hypothetical protein HQL22_09185 [Candidatus Omnitrophica bacterium]|nr:hypothetical protein [Candidatus Omnitrophota bacterium]
MSSNGKGGRTVFVFLTLIVIILLCGVAISLFLLQKETQTRRATEVSLEEARVRNAKVEAALKETEKQVDVLKGKSKDADDKINSLMEELDLQAALRDEIKAENKKLKDLLEAEGKSKVEMRQKLTTEIEASQAKLKDLEAMSAVRAKEIAGYQQKVDALQKQNGELEGKLKDLEQSTVARPKSEIIPVPGQGGNEKVNLDRIVITPDSAKEGRVLNVDSETEFLIFDLGGKNGIKQGDVMSVYRGKTYLGDVKVSRVQDEMSAADFIPPFSSRKVRKNDSIVPKR